MAVKTVERDGVEIYSRTDGCADPEAPTLVLSHALGTDHRVFDRLLPHLPDAVRLVRYDLRGHGNSGTGKTPFGMGKLVSDAEAVCEAHDVRAGTFVGLSIGGMIGQGLSVKRTDLVGSLVLMCTAARIGTAALWQDRIDTVTSKGLAEVADGIVDRWFAARGRDEDDVALWRNRLAEQSAEGYAAAADAIKGTDLYAATAGLRLPVLGIAGSEDRATPPDLVRETVELVPGSRFEIVRGAGHLPPVDRPKEVAALLMGFLRDLGQV